LRERGSASLSRSLAAVLFKSLKEIVRIVRRVVVNDVGWVVRVNLINVFAKFGTRLRLNLLNLLEST